MEMRNQFKTLYKDKIYVLVVVGGSHICNLSLLDYITMICMFYTQ